MTFVIWCYVNNAMNGSCAVHVGNSGLLNNKLFALSFMELVL